MNATAKELRTQSGRLLKRVAAGEQVTITFRGKKIAKLIAVSDAKKTTKPIGISPKDEIFGLWKEHENALSVDATIRNLRKSRSF